MPRCRFSVPVDRNDNEPKMPKFFQHTLPFDVVAIQGRKVIGLTPDGTIHDVAQVTMYKEDLAFRPLGCPEALFRNINLSENLPWSPKQDEALDE